MVVEIPSEVGVEIPSEVGWSSQVECGEADISKWSCGDYTGGDLYSGVHVWLVECTNRLPGRLCRNQPSNFNLSRLSTITGSSTYHNTIQYNTK